MVQQEIAFVKEGAEKDLAAAKPALDAAVAALNSITPKDIVGLKALKSPPTSSSASLTVCCCCGVPFFCHHSM